MVVAGPKTKGTEPHGPSKRFTLPCLTLEAARGIFCCEMHNLCASQVFAIWHTWGGLGGGGFVGPWVEGSHPFV